MELFWYCIGRVIFSYCSFYRKLAKLGRTDHNEGEEEENEEEDEEEDERARERTIYGPCMDHMIIWYII